MPSSLSLRKCGGIRSWCLETGHAPISSPRAASGFRRAGAERHARLLPPVVGGGAGGGRSQDRLSVEGGTEQTGQGARDLPS